jgi:putative membrane-bound dehydrogenase-like protein
MKHRLVVSVALLAAALSALPACARPLRIFIRASNKTHGPGQHDYPRFLADWTTLLDERGAAVEGALRFPTKAELDKTDVLLMYASDGNNLAPTERALLEAFVKRGGGVVALHDTICGTNADWFKTVVGGAKVHGETNWSAGVMGLYFGNYQHPISEGVSNFDLDDELFFKLHLMPGVKVIASTFHTAKEIVPQMWTYEKGWGRAFVSLQGHHYATFSHPAYRGLLLRGIAWAGRQPVDSLLKKEELASFRYPDGGPIAPDDAMKRIRIQRDFDIKLVASEPTVVNPIAVEWDPSGRMWVALTPEYPFKETPARIPGKDSIIILDGPDGDGRFAKRAVFYEGLVLPTSFVFYRDGVIVAQAPQILFLRDRDGDGKANRKQILFDGFGRSDTHAVINNLRWGLDGWIYGCQGYSGNDSTNIVNARRQRFGKIGNGIFRFKPDGSAMEQVSSYGGNSWGIDFNWEGELFHSKANGPHLNHVVMPERFLARGKLANAASDKAIPDHEKVNPIFTDKRHEYVQVSPVGVFTAASGCTIYEGGAWPERYYGSAFVCEPTVHIVHEDILFRSESPTFESTRRDETEFIAGNDLWFRPVHTRVGPDGAMYLLDFYNQAISHNDIRGIEHGKGNAAVRPDRDHRHGRIWRITHQEQREFDVPNLAKAASGDLVNALQHPNFWVRLNAQRLMMERQDKSVVPALASLLQTNRMMYVRVHALWTLHLLNALADTNLVAAIADKHPSVVNNALRVVSELRAEPGSNVIKEVVKQLKDTHERTRLDALCALTAWKPGTNVIANVGKLFPDLKDAWSKSAVLGVARLAPTNFIRLAFASDKAENYRELITPLIEDVIARKDADTAAWVVGHLAKAGGAADKLKVAVLNAFAKHLNEFAPTWTANVEAGLKALMKADNRTVRVSAFPLASCFDKPGYFEGQTAALRAKLLDDLSNEKLKEEDRTALLTSLMTIKALQPEVMAEVDLLLSHPKGAPGAVQKTSITELGRVPDRAAASVLIKNFTKLNTENRQLAFSTLLRRPDWGMALLDALDSKTIKLADLGVQGASRLLTHPDKALAKRAAAIIESIQGPPTPEKEALIAKFRPTLGQTPDVKKGKEQFEKNCALCHKFADKGKDLGPELTGAGLNDSLVLLTHILDPNRVVEGNFISYNVTTRKGEEYSGLIKTENKESVTLRNLEGEVELRRADIESMRSSGLSLMPEGLEALGEKTIRDIIGYITANKPKGFRALDLGGAFTADSRRGLYAVAGEAPSLAFKQYGIVMVDNIPFNIVNPATTPAGKNVIVLKGGSGFAKTLPQRVEFKAGTKVAKLYILGGVAGWGFPYGDPDGYNVPACKATLHYADGETEEIVWKNGEEFADYVRPYEVPGSKAVPELVTSGQLRWFSFVPRRQTEISKVVLESFDNNVAPTFVAMTAQVE